MLRTLITVLVGLPLLAPPGMCVCQFGPDRCCALEAAQQPDSSPAQSRTAQKHACCKCTDCCQHADNHTEKTPPRCSGIHMVSQDELCAHHQSTPLDRHHAPGCPALRTADHSKWSEPVSVRLRALQDIFSVCQLVEQDDPSLAAKLPCSSFRMEQGQPLYITLRTLLI